MIFVERLMRLTICAACLIALAPVAQAKHETVTGKVLAYIPPTGCINNTGFWTAIIKIEPTKSVNATFIRLSVAVDCGGFPPWSHEAPKDEKFKVEKLKNCDEVLEKGKNGVSVWKLTEGTQEADVPFGQVIPCYGSGDAPDSPFSRYSGVFGTAGEGFRVDGNRRRPV